MSFIGRGEARVQRILERLYPGWKIRPQVPIQSVILKEDFDFLDEVYQKHKFDFVMEPNTADPAIVIEVNYKHGDIPAAKWNNVFFPAIIKAGKIPLPIEDFSCRKPFNTKEERPLNWNDFRDVIDALEMSRIEP